MSYGTIALPIATGTPAATPRYAHDCECCRFIGHADVQDEAKHDVYLCRIGSEELTLRYGSEEHEYRSLPAAMVERSIAGMPFAYGLAAILLSGLRAGRLD